MPTPATRRYRRPSRRWPTTRGRARAGDPDGEEPPHRDACSDGEEGQREQRRLRIREQGQQARGDEVRTRSAAAATKARMKGGTSCRRPTRELRPSLQAIHARSGASNRTRELDDDRGCERDAADRGGRCDDLGDVVDARAHPDSVVVLVETEDAVQRGQQDDRQAAAQRHECNRIGDLLLVRVAEVPRGSDRGHTADGESRRDKEREPFDTPSRAPAHRVPKNVAITTTTTIASPRPPRLNMSWNTSSKPRTTIPARRSVRCEREPRPRPWRARRRCSRRTARARARRAPPARRRSASARGSRRPLRRAPARAPARGAAETRRCGQTTVGGRLSLERSSSVQYRMLVSRP